MYSPKPDTKVTQNDGFEKKINGLNVQFRPQYIKMKARPGVPLAFNMSYLPAVDFPLDVYYLMDTSYSMKNKVNDLKGQAKKLHQYLSNYTNNVRIGVGSFVEKAAFPFFDHTR